MADGVGKFEQFVKFGTDAYGLERLLRLLQALVTILLFTPPSTLTTLPLPLPLPTSLLPILTPATLTPSANASPPSANPSASSASSTPSPAPGGSSSWARRAAGWADFGARAFTGMYLLLESLVFVEVVLDVPGLGVWSSAEVVRGMVVDGQRFWFVGLVCGIVGAVVRLGGKERGEGRGKVVRRLVADVMDLAVPGSVVGWVPLEPRTVGLLMLGSTVLTGMEVWERCGMDVAAAKIAARDR
ncbi:hypothetical protein B0I37DRAFT_436895 [Chaetomium sp. MPI-CAGE-AT-0009]|nr:hypothetical protein B0I37DRAFT_436895 [Chaetomium sp. MPI-CAGE-AT-0009]